MNAIAQLREQGREISALAQQIRELCGDDDIAFVDTLDGETDAIRAASAVLRFIGAMEAMEEAAKGLANRYAARAKDFSDRAARARSAMLQFMSDIGEKSLLLSEGTVTVKAGVRKLVGEPDVASLPDRFVRVKREVDRAAIKSALEHGESVPGCELSNATPVLQIRK
jgi:phage host-nuclease inhibitor protein Gam